MLIFFLELAVAVLAFLFQDWVRDRFREFFESNIRSYRDDIDLQNLIDSLQKAVSTVTLLSRLVLWVSLQSMVVAPSHYASLEARCCRSGKISAPPPQCVTHPQGYSCPSCPFPLPV